MNNKLYSKWNKVFASWVYGGYNVLPYESVFIAIWVSGQSFCFLGEILGIKKPCAITA